MSIKQPLHQDNVCARECINHAATIKEQSGAGTLCRGCWWGDETPAVLERGQRVALRNPTAPPRALPPRTHGQGPAPSPALLPTSHHTPL